MMEKTESFRVVCQGGLNSNNNWLDLSQNYPGMASALVNFEPSLFGGYRRINGFQALESAAEEVDAAGAEGKILGVFFFGDSILCARKQQAGATYEFYEWNPGNAWTKLTTGLTLVSTAVEKIRYATFNFNGTDKIIFVDGVNKATIYDGTNWTQVDSTKSGADYANAGGAQAIDAPKYVTVFKNHVFISGDASAPNVVSHSAPNAEYDWTSANGAGQIPAGFQVVQIKPFRDNNYVFGVTDIKKITVSGANFVLEDVTANLGCLASDSVIEVNGDLLFLSQDGFRPISATERNNDVELGSLSKNIQQKVIDLIAQYSSLAIDSVLVRNKSQVRFFFSNESTDSALAPGIIAGLRGGPSGTSWEWGELKGIATSCCASAHIGSQEYVLHGGYDGKVYRQEFGNSFAGENIEATYSTPYFDFGDTYVRKSIKKVQLFTRPEGAMSLRVNLKYNWGNTDTINPATYTFESSGSIAVYGEAVYGVSTYGGEILPVTMENVEGSGQSVRLTIHTTDTNPSYTIQGMVYQIMVNGRK